MPEPTEVLIIRHGQTDWNREKRLQGHSDIPLNEKGIAQAQVLSRFLQKEPICAVFSSDLQRAFCTAEEIARFHHIPVQTDPAFRERSYGAFEGLTRDDIRVRYPDSHAAWYAADPDHVFPAGEREAESIRIFHDRAIRAIHKIALPYGGKKIVLVTHFGLVEAAFREAQQLPLEVRTRVPVLNTSINRFLVSKDCIALLKWSDDRHLDSVEKQPVDYLKHF